MRVLRVAFLSSAVLEFCSISIALVAVYLGMSYLGYIEFGAYGIKLTLTNGKFILLLAPDVYLPLRELGVHYHARAQAVGAAEAVLGILTVSPQAPLTGAISWTTEPPIHIHCRDPHLAFKDNNRIGRPQASDTEIEQAARSAGVLDLALHLGQGLETMVEEHGLGLS